MWPNPAVEVQSSTLDDLSGLPPTLQIQTAERQSWAPQFAALKACERFP